MKAQTCSAVRLQASEVAAAAVDAAEDFEGRRCCGVQKDHLDRHYPSPRRQASCSAPVHLALVLALALADLVDAFRQAWVPSVVAVEAAYVRVGEV